MDESKNAIRIVIALDKYWRVDQLANFLMAIDGLICRVEAIYILCDILRRYNEELSSLQAMGLLKPGVSPNDWEESQKGTDALSRHGYLQVAKVLRQYGINVRTDYLGWQVNFDFDDIYQIIPSSQHLELEYFKLSSPGLAILSKVGGDALKQTFHYLRLLFLSFFSAEDRQKVLSWLRRESEAYVNQQETESKIYKHIACQEKTKSEMLKNLSKKLESNTQTNAKNNTSLQLDLTTKQDFMRLLLRESGVPKIQLDQKVFIPLNRQIDAIARMKCEGFISAIMPELNDIESCYNDKGSDSE